VALFQRTSLTPKRNNYSDEQIVQHLFLEHDGEQIIGREGETATLLKRSLVSLTLRAFGFAPRHVSR
jgi:hypothetical protein